MRRWCSVVRLTVFVPTWRSQVTCPRPAQSLFWKLFSLFRQPLFFDPPGSRLCAESNAPEYPVAEAVNLGSPGTDGQQPRDG